MKRVLLDTSFLLPTLGIRVEDPQIQKVLDWLQEQHLPNLIFYSELVLLEAHWVLIRRSRRDQVDEARFFQGLQAIIEDYVLAATTPEHWQLAWNLKNLGHGDLVDCLLVAIAARNQLYLLTVDQPLTKFLEMNQLNHLKQWVLLPSDLLG